MDSHGAARKRGRSDTNGGVAGAKRLKEAESIQPGLGSKSKPCTKFFSTAGCPFGEGCHFQHYVPGGVNAVLQKTNLGNAAPAPPRPVGPKALPEPAVKTRMCNKYNTAEGCKFGDKCHFAHGERELGKPFFPSYEEPLVGGRLAGRLKPPPQAVVAGGFGASATAKISVDASLAGAIIGKGGANTKHINRTTGAKLSIRDHETDPNLKNIELEGTFDQIKQASSMVTELIVNISATTPLPAKSTAGTAPVGPDSSYKTKLCDNFAKGSCTFGDRCKFAHGPSELRNASA